MARVKLTEEELALRERQFDETIEGFNAAIGDFLQRLLPAQVKLAQKKLALELFRRIVMRTPVDTGRARGNWQLTIGAPATDILPIRRNDANISMAGAILNLMTPYSDIWITNNVPYILALEYGHSDQAPKGMVRVSLDEVKAMVL